MTPELTSILNFIQTQGLNLTFKVLILALLLVYILFTFIVISRVKVLNRTLTLSAGRASFIIQALAIIFLLLGISLFLATLVIV